MANSALLSSPTLSAATNSSFELVSLRSGSYASHDDSDDEIVWSVSSGYQSLTESGIQSLTDDDYVVLSRRRSPEPGSASAADPRTPQPFELIHSISKLTITDGLDSQIEKSFKSPKSHRKKKQPAHVHVIVHPSRPLPSPMATARPRTTFVKVSVTDAGLGSRPIVDDVSETLSVADSELDMPSMYEEAVRYITSFLSNPPHDSHSYLTFLQSLIIELGLADSSVPRSLTSAKALLRHNAFVNVRDYLAVREEGLAAIKRVMYPSKTALIKDIKRRKKTAPISWVKQNGLQVLLVSCYH